ncbi:hypothetical protein SAMN05444336_10792 [Albimonas donghaensis]|uniref:Uncharacterized protein n=1 Tax=Albimonas donghaensis TaxID=356660 RepID=A0A1H3D405_9RHOB|nr:hypothetical protein SAMN05444336_10792 [Albimonas donghaensis]
MTLFAMFDVERWADRLLDRLLGEAPAPVARDAPDG